MIIPELPRPWQKKSSQGTRYNADPFYRSKTWKANRLVFREGFTIMPDGVSISNKYCYQCYIEDKMRLPGSECDHITPIKAGGEKLDHANLRTLCRTHHAKKSSNEGKNFK